MCRIATGRGFDLRERMAISNATDRPCPDCGMNLFTTMAGFFPAVICKMCGYGALVLLFDPDVRQRNWSIQGRQEKLTGE